MGFAAARFSCLREASFGAKSRLLRSAAGRAPFLIARMIDSVAC